MPIRLLRAAWSGRKAEPDPAELILDHDGRLLRIAVRRRPGARRMTLRVSGAKREIVLTLPQRVSLAAARPFVEAHRGWIATRLARLPGRIPLSEGSELPVRGVPHLIRRAEGRGAVRIDRDGSEAPALLVRCDPDYVPGRVLRFLQAEARRDFAEAVARHAAALGVRPTRITVRDTTSRWGSCSASGALSFSWRLILSPPFVLDYLAAHEVAHLVEMNHSQRYWRLLKGICPATDEAEAWLKRHGSGLHRYG